MRAHHVIAVVAIVLIAFGVRIFFLAPVAEANMGSVPSSHMDVLQMHVDHLHRNDHPAQKMHDMTFVFSDSD